MIDAEQLNLVFRDCLFTEEEVAEANSDLAVLNPAVAEGLVTKVGFHRERLESHRLQITDWLQTMDDHFFENKGGGWSFLNMCTDRDGNLWTGSHQTVEQLVMLGLATGMVRLLSPRDMWGVLPGGMPYYSIKEAV